MQVQYIDCLKPNINKIVEVPNNCNGSMFTEYKPIGFKEIYEVFDLNGNSLYANSSETLLFNRYSIVNDDDDIDWELGGDYD